MRLPAFLALLALPVAALAEAQGGSRDDLLTVVAAAPYPVEIMAYCHRQIAADPVFVNVGRQWSERNGELLATLEDRATAAAVSDEARRAADQAALAAIVALVASQADQPAYCRFVAGIIDAGYYDIDRRADLAPALKRIFNVD